MPRGRRPLRFLPDGRRTRPSPQLASLAAIATARPGYPFIVDSGSKSKRPNHWNYPGGRGPHALWPSPSRGFGATHPLIALADRLHDEHHVRMGPLTTFYDGEAEDAEDREKLDMAWQEPALLEGELRKLVHAFEADPMCATFARRGDAATIPAEALALAELLTDAVAADSRVRLVYAL